MERVSDDVCRETTVKLFTPVRLFLAAVATASGFPPARNRSSWDVGRDRIGDYVVVSRSNDRSSVCDEYINPNALRVAGCMTPDRGGGDGWSAPFSDGRGLLAGAGVEFNIAGPWKLAFDYSRVQAVFDQTVASTNAQGVDFEKLSNELVVGQERLGALRTHGVHGVLHLYPIRSGRYSTLRRNRSRLMRPCARTSDGTAGAALTRSSSRRGRISRTSTRFKGISPARPAGARPCSGRTCTCSCVSGVSISRSAIGSPWAFAPDGSGTRRWTLGRTSARLCGVTSPTYAWMAASPYPRWSTLPGTGVTEVGVVLKYDLRGSE